MRQNIKSVVEDISEEVRKNGIEWVASSYMPWWTNFNFSNLSWTRLKLKNWSEYRLIEFNKWSEDYSDIDYFNWDDEWLDWNNIDCREITDMCRIVKFDENWEVWPLSNSKVSFTNLNFAVSWSWSIPKVTINFVARASVKEWIRAELAEKTKLIFQTTFSERVLEIK
jgi:hypothetical protein